MSVIDSMQLNPCSNFYCRGTLYLHRKEINKFNETLLSNADNLDIAACGLSRFIENRGDLLKEELERGLKLRILIPDLNNESLMNSFDKSENRELGFTRNTILELINWLEALDNVEVELKVYYTRPMDFYFAYDSLIFTGPYLNCDSQLAPTFHWWDCEQVGASYKSNFECVWEKAQTWLVKHKDAVSE